MLALTTVAHLKVLLLSEDAKLHAEMINLLSNENVALKCVTTQMARDASHDLESSANLFFFDLREQERWSDLVPLLLPSKTNIQVVGLVGTTSGGADLSDLLQQGFHALITWPVSRSLFRARFRQIETVQRRALHASRMVDGFVGKTSIAVVDDEINILTSMRMALEAEGYKVQAYKDGVSALEGLTAEPTDLAILDIKMPRMDGMELLRRLRQQSAIAVIFLTSKDEEIDELFGLKMGADDYIAKPFSQRLIIERVKAVLRRCRSRSDEITVTSEDLVMERGNLRLDAQRHICSWDGELVAFTVTEFLILQSLVLRPGAPRDGTAHDSAPRHHDYSFGRHPYRHPVFRLSPIPTDNHRASAPIPPRGPVSLRQPLRQSCSTHGYSRE